MAPSNLQRTVSEAGVNAKGLARFYSAVGRSLLRLALLLAVFAAVVGWGRVWERLETPDPFATRREFNISSMRMIAARPGFGSGLGTWPVVYPAYAIIDTGTFANRAHADWLEWTAEGGLPFGIAMATLFVWCLRPAFGSVWGVGVVAVFLHRSEEHTSELQSLRHLVC